MDKMLMQLLMFCIPALVTGGIAFLFFREHLDNENNRRNFLISKDLQKKSLPNRLQAYERLALFLERITPNSLLTRVQPTSQDKNTYETLLIATIEQEFEHNLTQQIYMSSDGWRVIKASKNPTIQLIWNAGKSDKVTNADQLREVILTDLMDKTPPTNAGLSYIKDEVGKIWH